MIYFPSDVHMGHSMSKDLTDEGLVFILGV